MQLTEFDCIFIVMSIFILLLNKQFKLTAIENILLLILQIIIGITLLPQNDEMLNLNLFYFVVVMNIIIITKFIIFEMKVRKH